MKHVGMTYTIDPKKTLDLAKYILDSKFDEYIGNRGIAIIKDKLSPLRRTGQLEDSWKWKPTKEGVEIYSQDWAASSIQQGWRQPPPKDEMLAWMNSKSEFSGMDSKEQERVSYAIRLTMLRGSSLGSKSTITSLAPVGQRRYDYFADVTKLIKDEIRSYFE